MQKATYATPNSLMKLFQDARDVYMKERGLKHLQGNWRMGVKAGLVLVLFFSSYFALVFIDYTAAATALGIDISIIAVVLAFIFAQGIILVGVCIGHDASHGALSPYQWVNKLGKYCFDMIGASSWCWHYKHVISHHVHTNVEDHDDDLFSSSVLRLSHLADRRWWHSMQWLYALPAYSLLTIVWMYYSDYKKLFSRKMCYSPIWAFIWLWALACQ